MRWLFLFGVSLEIAGAALVAWAIVSRPPAEPLEEALTKFGANFWVILFREREQAQVRVGLGVLSVGFLCQFLGFLGMFSGAGRVFAALAGLSIGAVAFFGGKRLARRPFPELHRTEGVDLIRDERHGYGLATLDDVVSYRQLYADRLYGRTLRPRPTHVEGFVASGNWVFACPDCGAIHVSLATPGLDTCVCSTCSGEFPIHFPSDRDEIERVLLKNPDPDRRNWKPGESLDGLQQNA